MRIVIILIVGVFFLQRLQLTKTRKSCTVLVPLVYYYIQCFKKICFNIQCSEKKTIYTRGNPLIASRSNYPSPLPRHNLRPHLKHCSILKNTVKLKKTLVLAIMITNPAETFEPFLSEHLPGGSCVPNLQIKLF